MTTRWPGSASMTAWGSTKAAPAAVLVARLLLGLLFTLAGLSGFAFLFASPPPAPAGLAGVFMDVFFKSHWVQFVDGVELVAGVLLLANRYVPFALVLLGAILANILVFHISLQPQGLPVALVVLALWSVLAYSRRAGLAPLFHQ